MEKCCECGGVFDRVESAIQNHEPCATKHGTQPTDVQQLKAEIAAFATCMESEFASPHGVHNIDYYIMRLRQLSAV
jgi:hypothetical protein